MLPRRYVIGLVGALALQATFLWLLVRPGASDAGDAPDWDSVSRLYGKPAPPLRVADARGVSKSVRWSDFKGKWVLVEFWAYW